MTPGGTSPDLAAVTVCEVDDVPGDGCVAVAGGRVLLARVDGRVVAWRNRCLHRGAPLDGGLVRDGVVTCPRHFWRYDLATGRNLAGGGGLDRVAVEERDGRVAVVPPAATPRDLRAMLLAHARTWTRDPDPTETT